MFAVEFESHLFRLPKIFPFVVFKIPILVLLVPTEMEFELVTRFPLIKLRLLTDILELSVTPFVLLIVKLLIFDGKPLPVT